jgi:hypothetical protein
VSLLVWEGRTMLEVAAQPGHGVDVCELYYARIIEGYDPARRTSAEQAIQAARRSEGRPMDVIRGETKRATRQVGAKRLHMSRSRRGDSNPRPHHYE